MISKLAHRYCYEVENIENYEQAMADPLEIWDCHHRYEIYNGRTISRSTLKNRGLLYNRPASELIFLRHRDHISLHIENMSEETCRKISENHANVKGKNNPMYGKHHNEESRKKMSESIKGKLCGDKNPMYGRFCESNPFYGKKHTEEQKKKWSESRKGRYRVYHEDGTYHYEKTTN